jgi:zinc protease
VREAIAHVLVPAQASACASVPHGRTDALTPTALAAALASPAEAMASVTLGTAPVAAPLAGPVRRVVAHGVHHLAVGSLDILAARHAGSGQVSLSLYRRRPFLDTLETAGHAVLAMRTMLRGTEARGAAALALRMERMGGVLSPLVSGDLVGLGATILAESAQDAAALLVEAAFQPRFDADDLAIERDLLREDARALTDDMVRFPFQLVLGAAFDDRGYGTPAYGTPTSLDRADATALRAWHAAAFGPGRTTLVAVGDREPAELAEALAATIGQVGAREATEADDDPTLATWRAAVRVEQRTRQQSALAMVFPGPSRRDPARHAAEVWAASAGGLGGTLFDALRDRRSLAYSVYAMSWQRRLAGGLLTYIACAPERLDEAREAMLEELAAAAAQPIGAVELARAIAMLAGQAEVARQTASAFAGEIANAWLLGDGLAELDAPGAAYRAVTARDVHAVAAAAFDPARRAEGVVAALEAAPR